MPSLVPRVRGRIPLAADRDAAAALAHIAQELRACECNSHVAADGRLIVESGTPGRYSPLSFVDGGEIRVVAGPGERWLHYDFSTRGGFLLCLILSPVCAAAAWFGTGDAGLTWFGLLAPVLWLYGANYIIACVRVPGWLRRLVEAGARNGRA